MSPIGIVVTAVVVIVVVLSLLSVYNPAMLAKLQVRHRNIATPPDNDGAQLLPAPAGCQWRIEEYNRGTFTLNLIESDQRIYHAAIANMYYAEKPNGTGSRINLWPVTSVDFDHPTKAYASSKEAIKQHEKLLAVREADRSQRETFQRQKDIMMKAACGHRNTEWQTRETDLNAGFTDRMQKREKCLDCGQILQVITEGESA